MGVVAKGGNSEDFRVYRDGVYPALCVDVVDLGIQETPFVDERTGKKKKAHKAALVWQLHVEEEKEDGTTEVVLRTDGKPFLISQYYTLSLNAQANLRRDLDSWRGQPFTDQELEEGFDVERLLNVQCQLSIGTKPGKKEGDKGRKIVSAVLPKHRHDPRITIDPDFKRQKDTPGGKDVRSPKAPEGQQQKPQQQAAQVDPFQDDEEEPLPF